MLGELIRVTSTFLFWVYGTFMFAPVVCGRGISWPFSWSAFIVPLKFRPGARDLRNYYSGPARLQGRRHRFSLTDTGMVLFYRSAGCFKVFFSFVSVLHGFCMGSLLTETSSSVVFGTFTLAKLETGAAGGAKYCPKSM